MAHGIKVINSSGRTVIDTTQGLSLLYATSHSTATADTAFPVANHSGTDLILARPASSAVGSLGRGLGRVSRRFNGNWGAANSAFPNSTNGNGGGYVVWRELKAQSTANLSVGGQGLVVYDGAGTASSNILFSATDLDTTAQLVASGKWNGTAGGTSTAQGYYQEFSMDSSLDEGRYYVLTTSSASFPISSSTTTDSGYHADYEFNYQTGKIRMLNYFVVEGATGAFGVNELNRVELNRDWAIFYLINGGSVDNNFS